MRIRVSASFFMALSVLALGIFPPTLLGAPSIIPAPPQLAAEGYLLIDADTRHVIAEHNSRQRLAPASLTKIMTSYISATEIENGRLKLSEDVDISVKAWRMEGSRMFIQEGTKVTVSDLIRGIVIQSGNDASVALAEHISGSEQAFADVMNQHATLLGMTDTHYVNATGLPDEDHYTTATDLATLAIALIKDHPEHYRIYKEKYFSFNEIRQPNRNQLLWRDKSVDGIKTGHTDAAGYCLVSSAKRNGMRLIAIVMGAKSEQARASESQRLLSYGFRYYETLHLYKAGETLRTVRVWGGDKVAIDLGVSDEMIITVPHGLKGKLEASLDVQGVIKAPFKAGDTFGTLKVKNGDVMIAERPLVALNPVQEAGFFSGVLDAIILFFTEVFSGDTLTV